MRLAVVTREPPRQADRTGALRLGRLAERFADRGHDVTVYCVGWWLDSGRQIEFDGLRYEAVTFERSPLFFTRLPGVLARRRPDAVLVTPSPPAVAVAAAIGGGLARVPVVCDWYGDESGVDDSWWARAATRLPTHVVTPSELHRTRVRSLGATAERTSVIPQSIDLSLVESTPPAPRRDVVYANRLDEDANLESLLLALAELRRRGDWTAAIIGDGPRRTDYERQARDLAIHDRIEFLGDRTRKERIALYRGAHTVVQTARRVPFAEELLWALACGCVGVVEYHSNSSAHELIERRERGVRVTDMESLGEAIEEASTYGFRDIDESLSGFDHAAVVDSYLELFCECGADAT